jgi:hypothetical protein
MARTLTDYTRRPCPQRMDAQKLDWLYAGSGCCERIGTEYDAHIAAGPALSAALSILVEVPLEHPDDHTALLATLIYTGWRQLPGRHKARVAQGIEPPRLGHVGEVELYINRRLEFGMRASEPEAVEEMGDSGTERAVPQTPAPAAARADPRMLQMLQSLKRAAWFIVCLLALIFIATLLRR